MSGGELELDALKLSVYFGERARVGGRLLGDELLELYGSAELRLSILLRGAQGFGAKHRLRTDRLLTLSEDLPVVALAVDRRERIHALLPAVKKLMRGGLIALERASVVNPADADPLTATADLLPDSHQLKLTVYLGRHDRVDGAPAFAAACALLHERGVSGATVFLGVDGTMHGVRRRARFFARNQRVPMMILTMGAREEILASLSALRGMLPDGLFTLERVRVCKRDGNLLQAPHPPEGLLRSPTGEVCLDATRERGERQKLTVIASEATTHGGRPLHVELMRRLRATRVAGATSLRGMWGFHGDHPPHGDRLLSPRRHVPIVTTMIDVPERIAQAFSIVDELTAERGLVTSELMPANMALARGCSSVG